MIADNIFYDLDTSALSTAFLGPYTIVMIKISRSGEAPIAVSVRDNLFSMIERVDNAEYIRNATDIRGNQFLFR